MFKTLPISGKWKMEVNNYFDFNAKDVTDTKDSRRIDLNSTMLGIRSDEGFIIDFGWVPEGDINGHYQLELLSDDWQTTYLSITSHDLTEIEKVLFPLLSLQPNHLKKIAVSGSINHQFKKNDYPILISTFLFSGWKMDLNLIYTTTRFNDPIVVYKSSQIDKGINVEIAIIDSTQFSLSLIYNELEIQKLTFKNHTFIPNEINRFMSYYHENLNSQDFKGLMGNYH